MLVSSGSPSVSSSACTNAWSGMRTPTVFFFGCSSRRGTSWVAGQDERVRPRRRRLDRPERRVVDLHELPELGEVLAHQREVVPVVEAADPQDPVAAVAVAELAAERVAGVGRVGDQLVVAQRVGDLPEQPRLRVVRVDVEVAGHVRPGRRP